MGVTTTATLTQELFDAISAELLIAVDDVYIYDDNGPVTRKGPDEIPAGAKTVAFNAPTLPNPGAAAYAETARRLTDGTDIDSNSIAVAMSQVILTFREYGGPHDGTAVRPFALTELLKRMAIHDLVPYVGGLLNRDRRKWLNTVWQSLLLTSTNVVTPNAAAEGAITAGQAASRVWLDAMLKGLQDAKVPTYADGFYRMAITTQQLKELKADTSIRQSLDFAGGDNPLFKGYIGSYSGFHFMTDTTMPTKGVGAGSAVTAQQALAWGPYGLGQAVLETPDVREDVNTDFGRRQRIIWRSVEGVGLLYSSLVFRGITT